MEDVPVKTAPASKRKRILYVGGIIILIVAAGAGTYFWQHPKLVASLHANSQLASKNRLLKGQLSSLQADDQKAKAELKQYTAKQDVTQADLDLKVLGTAYVNPFGNGSGYFGAYVGVNVTITNPTKADVYVATSLFKLKDAQENVYPTYSPENVQNTGLPQGYTKLIDQTISSKESVKGTIIFQLPNDSLRSFQLINGAKTYSATVK